MSLTDYLQQYSQQIAARQEHNEDVDEAVRERKANTLEEQFQHAKDAIESAGAEIGGAGAAFHLGRKIYRRVQDRKAARVKQTSQANSNAADQQTRGADGQGESPADAPTEEPRPPIEEAPTDAPTPPAEERPTFERPTEDPATRGATGATDEAAPQPAPEGGRAGTAPREDLGSIQEEPEIRGGQRTQLARTDEPTAEAQQAMDRNAQLRQSQAAEEAKDPASTSAPEAAEHGGANAPATETSDPATLQGVNDRAAATGNRIGNALPEEGSEPSDLGQLLNNRTATPLQSSGSEPPSHTGSSANDAPSAQPATEQPAPSGNAKPSGVAGEQAGSAEDVEEGARAFQTASEGRAATNTAARIAADGKSAIDDTATTAVKTVASKVGQKLGTSSALEGIGDALDFLGPIGEGLGIITSLVGLFEGLGHKKADPDADTQQAQKTGQFASGTTGAGLDVKALTSQPTGALTATY